MLMLTKYVYSSRDDAYASAFLFAHLNNLLLSCVCQLVTSNYLIDSVSYVDVIPDYLHAYMVSCPDDASLCCVFAYIK